LAHSNKCEVAAQHTTLMVQLCVQLGIKCTAQKLP